MLRSIRCGLGIPVLCACCFAAGDSATSLKPRFSGFGFYEFGQIAKGTGVYQDLNNVWISRALGGLYLDIKPMSWAEVRLGGEGEIAFSYLVDKAYGELGTNVTRLPRFSFYLTQAEAIAGLGDPAKIRGQAEVGYFPLKYNPQVRNLGEYLFRTRPYPGYIDNSFDMPFGRLLGVRLGGIALKDITADVLLTSEVNRFPLQDFSVSALLGYNAKKILDVGVGCMFERLFSVDSTLTHPHHGTNRYLENSDTTVTTTIDTLVDPPTTRDSIYVTGDTGYYTFAGTKVVARATFDPKAVLRLFSIPTAFFGEEDLKIYGEFAILGLQDYPKYYEDILQRIPRMVGFNIPAFKILDVLALEFEWWDSKYPNSYEQIFRLGDPIPGAELGTPRCAHDRLRWSIYASRKIADHFTLTTQFARDHMHPIALEIDKPETFDVVPGKEDWWWVVKVQYGF